MTATALSAEEYAARVRAALADLPAGTREEVLADLPAHLADVAADRGPAEGPEGPGDSPGDRAEVDLVERLGPPEAYAAELRAAAGLPAAPGPAPRRSLLVELAPVRWLLRGVFAGLGVALVAAAAVGVASLREDPQVDPPAASPAREQPEVGAVRWVPVRVAGLDPAGSMVLDRVRVFELPRTDRYIVIRPGTVPYRIEVVPVR